MVDCYVGLGGNFEGTLQAMELAVAELERTQGITELTLSEVYHTTPVSAIPQDDYLNSVCRFNTTLPLNQLWSLLQELQTRLGQGQREKDAPRLIDLDLLFYGDLVLESDAITLPHPRWRERLFVLTPLSDVTDMVPTGERICELLKYFSNPHQERVERRHTHASCKD